ncbi:hypothetical protein L3Q82_005199 [Scortum barcoo]|uniref:Uncharacterized protein n=1 Tax=Scortum barcoo TaxID=214431 RepID=A0ACB8VAI0_9TELE|nr:hypothetical protein L3Q82_005199 [Scortum barcoo]
MSHREEALGEDPGHAGETMSLSWPGNASGSPRKSWRKCLGAFFSACRAAAVPHDDAGGQDALHHTSVEGGQD